MSERHAKPVTNAQHCATNKTFLAACAKFNVTPTPRQVAKFRAKKGLLWKRLTGFIAIDSKHEGSC